MKEIIIYMYNGAFQIVCFIMVIIMFLTFMCEFGSIYSSLEEYKRKTLIIKLLYNPVVSKVVYDYSRERRKKALTL